MQSYHAARAAEGLRVLEIGCGTGCWTQFIAPAASEVVALEAAPETLRVGSRTCRCGGDPRSLQDCMRCWRRALVSDVAGQVSYTQMDYFWTFEYVVAPRGTTAR